VEVVDLYVVQSRAASGATGVQIWENIRSRRLMIAHIGSAHTPGERAAVIDLPARTAALVTPPRFVEVWGGW